MTKAKAARISLAMILAFALLLCGFAIFRSDARAEETAIENGGEYMIVFARTESDETLHYWAATSTISSNALVMVDLGTSLPASVAPTEENASRTFILSKTADAETYQIVAKGISGTSNYLNIANTSKTSVSFGSNGDNAIFDLVSNGDGTYNIFATASSNRNLSIAKANTNEPAAKFYAKTASNENTYIFDAYLVPVKETSVECDHSTTSVVNEKAATCTEDGYTGDVVCSCGATISKGQVIASEGHKYVDGTCSACGAEDTDYSGNYYIATKRSSGNYWYMTSDLGTASTERYQAVNSGSTTLPDSITGGIINQIFTIVSNGDGTYKIYANGVEGDNYLGWSSGNSGTLVAEDKALDVTIDAIDDGTFNIHFTASDAERYLSLNNSNSYFAWYAGTQTQDLILVPVEEADEECTHTETKIENKKDATCTEDGYTGDVVCSSCGITVTEGQVIASEGHKYIDGTCSVCGAEDPTSTDYSGTYYIATIRSSGNYWYMTSTLTGSGSSRRYQAVDSGLTALPASITGGIINQIFTIVSNGDGTYKIYANGVEGNNYLGWTSGNYGILVSEDSALDVTIAKNGDCVNIIYNGARYLSLNSSSGSDFFAWYAGTQKQDLTLIPVTEDEPESDFKITGAQVNAGTSLKVTYRVEVNAGALAEGDKLAMKFTRNGETVTITLDYSESGEYFFTIGGIAPHQMGDLIDAELIAIKGGNEESVGSKAGYSVEENLINLANTYKDDAKLVALIHDMLAYGKAAQEYKEYNTSDVIGDGFTITPSTATPDQSDAAKFSGTDTYIIYSAGVRFDDVNKLYFIFKDLGDATVTVNGKEYTTDDMVDMGDGCHKLYTDAISATQLGTVYTVVAGDSTLTYSTSAYALSKMSDDNMGELALALYRYGVSAKAYAEAN